MARSSWSVATALSLLAATLVPFPARVAAQPGVPSPVHSTVPTFIDLVGSEGGIPDPSGAFTVIVRDNTPATLAGVVVTVDFSGCPDSRPSAAQPYPGLSTDCGLRTVSATTDAQGSATFVILGSVLQRTPVSPAGCAVISAGSPSVTLGNASVAVYDQDGIDGVTERDVELATCDITDMNYHPRSDYNHSGADQFNDGPVLIAREMAGTSAETGSRCDSQPTVTPTVVATQGGVNLAWNDCISGGGTQVATFDCSSVLPTSRSAIGSVVAPPDITSLVGFEAVVVLVGGDPSLPLPDYWRLDPAGCQFGTTVVGSGPSTVCTSVGGGDEQEMTYPYNEPYAARFVVRGFGLGGQALTAGVEYTMFDITRSRSGPNPNSCSGCERPVEFKLQSIKLLQGPTGCSTPGGPPLPNVLVNQTATSDIAYWQASFTDVGPAGSAELVLARDGSNPTRGELAITFTLAGDAPASIELFDLTGRRLKRTEIDASGSRGRRMTLARPGELEPGLYFVKLAQGSESRRLKVTVLQ